MKALVFENMPPDSRPSSHETEVALLRERAESQREVIKELRALVESVQVKLAQVATREQVDGIHKDVTRALELQSQEVRDLKTMVYGPPGQEHLGLLTRVEEQGKQLALFERRWERVAGYVLGASAAGGGIGAFVHSLLSR